ncbi:MAG: TldD/PmbA family protein [Deltaproteobacteria bacterium]|nr:TldD/PmbA family protein [Deltaproteobacteria bacterium]
MKPLLKSTIEYLRKKGVDYGDIRFERVKSESIQVKDGAVEGFSRDSSLGIGIRVLYKGAWGFAATNMLTDAGVKRAADEAFMIAAAFASVNVKKTVLTEAVPHIDSYTAPFKIDPFSIPPEEKIETLLDLTETAMRAKGIAIAEAFMEFSKSDKEFLSTEGAHISQSIITSGGGYHVIAEDKNDAQKRSYPDGHHGLFATKGYELIGELDMKGSLERVTREARELLKAKECPAGVTDIIIDGSQLALQLHESCGHPAELDRVLGSEVGFAGGSFLSLEKRGSFRYGSKDVNIYADPNHSGGAGSYRYDDEGVRVERVDIVKDGVFLNYLTSRESAAALGGRSNGSMRAERWSGMPLIRMSNVCMEPGNASLSDLIADTKDGLFLSTNRSWSIDDLRLNFQFGTEIAYEIKNGRIGQVFKNPVYYGITPKFWASCDGVCNKDEWRIWGLNSCAKGEPMQVAHVGHGASPARFRSVSVGVSRD